MKTLIIMVGLPASGKTTFRDKIVGATVVCPDDHIPYTKENPWTFHISKQAWKTADKELQEACKNGDERVVFDATMLTPKKRRKYIQLAKQNNYEAVAVYCATPEDICRQRNDTRDTYRKVPESIIDDMSKRLVPPDVEEGFSAIVRIIEDGINPKREITGKYKLEELNGKEDN